jgi:hypothetical protein
MVVCDFFEVPSLKSTFANVSLGTDMGNSLIDLLKTIFVFAFPGIYGFVVVWIALYFQVLYGWYGFITIAVLLFPVVYAWYKILSNHEKKILQAELKGYKVSPERTTETLDEYEKLVVKEENENV